MYYQTGINLSPLGFVFEWGHLKTMKYKLIINDFNIIVLRVTLFQMHVEK